MTTTTMRPGEYEAMLQARLADIRASRRTTRRARHQPRGRVRPKAAGFFAIAGALVLGATAAIASHGDTVIDLTIADEIVEHQDAVFIQGGLGAGTGTFDPFLTLSPGGNDPTEAGYNQCDDPGCPVDTNYDQFFGGGRTHELLVSAVPVIEFEGQMYREFSLDANDQGADSFMSVDDIRVFLDDQDNLTGFNSGTDTFSNDSGTTATKVFDLDMPILVESQTLEPGSGVSDITVLLPVDLFPEECFYGSLTCDAFLIFYTESGFAGVIGDRNYDVTSGFEEWRVQLLPVVNVAKTADVSLTRTFPWDVAKEADGEPDVIDLFAGDTATIDWTVTATVGTPVDSDLLVSGTITITNPTGGDVIQDDIPATINSVTDVLTQGLTDTPLAVSCPESFPFTLGAQDELVCTYSGTPPDSTNGTNTATANIDINETDTADYSGTAPVDFGAADVTEVDECIEVTDDNATPGDTGDDRLLDAELCEDESPGVYNFSTDVGPFDVGECGQTTITNTAYTETNDSATLDSAADSVLVNCYELTVSKTANESFGTEFDWTIEKSVDPATLDLFDGDSGTVTWTVDVFKDAGTPSGWAVSGTITINNPAPIAADDVSVVDMISGVGAATVDCGAGATTVDVAAAGSAQCSYSSALPDGSTRTNTATATLFGEDYEGTAEINFTGVNPTLTDDTATVTDDRGPLNELVTDDDQFTYEEVFDCGEEEGTHDNTAVVTETDSAETDDDTATATVNCYDLSVSKTADESFTRTFEWDILKSADQDALTLMPGETFPVNYTVTVDVIGETDDDFKVEGDITIHNNHPTLDADLTGVTDEVFDSIAATVDCPSLTVPAGGDLTCTYEADLPDDTERLNTATATQQNYDYDADGIGTPGGTTDYSGTATVTFGDPTDLVDECVDVNDTIGGFLGTVCVDDVPPPPTDLTYTDDVGPYTVEDCGEQNVPNTADLLTNDTGATDESSWNIVVTIPCPEGCTLTMGYWKTHNESFLGGAPADPNWFLIGDVDGDGTSEGELEDFFDTGMTWFDVFWTNPAGRPYYQLAHQWMAAYINKLSIEAIGGSIPAEVQDALDDGADLLDEFDGSEAGKNPDIKGKDAKAIRAEFVELAGILGDFNEGTTGPGHCDEPIVILTSTTNPALFLPIGLLAPLSAVLRRRRR